MDSVPWVLLLSTSTSRPWRVRHKALQPGRRVRLPSGSACASKVWRRRAVPTRVGLPRWPYLVGKQRLAELPPFQGPVLRRLAPGAQCAEYGWRQLIGIFFRHRLVG